MAEICMDVDTALSEVPVNIAPLIDDTDFKTIEDAVAYNATGMDLRWNFVTTGGAYTSTAVTPTTAGTYDWTHQGDGMYSIEIPASGGASINNDTEGFGWFSGKATGVLPWRGPIICFRSASLNNALVDGSINLPVNVIQVQTSDDAATGLSTAGLHYDAYDHFDTDQNLLSSAITTVNSQTEFVLTSGSTVNDAYNGMMVVINGTLAERWAARVVDYVGATKTLTISAAAYWTVDTADSINIIGVPQQVTALPTATAGAAGGVFIAGTNAATSVTTALTANITGNLSGSVGSVTGAVGSVTGAVGSVTGNVGGNVVGSVGSVTGAVGSVTGAVGSVTGNVGGNVTGSVGSVATGGITAASIATGAIDADALATDAVAEIADGVWDEVLTAAAHNVANSAGRRLRTLQDVGNYLGYVWIDTNGANTGSTFPDDGTFLNPVNTLANALTVAAAATQPIKEFSILSGSTITLASTFSGYDFNGENWTLALGGQDISGSRFNRAASGVSGTATGTNPFFYECSIGNATLPPAAIQKCGLAGTLTVGSAGDYYLVDCFSQVAGTSAPVLDMGAAVGATNVSLRRWSGGLTINNIASGDVISIDCVSGGTITLNGADGNVQVRGMCNVVDNRTGSPTLGTTNNMDARFDSVDTTIAAILVDTGTTLQAELDGIQADTEDIQTRLPAALVSGRIDASVGAMAANTLTASALATDAVTEIQSGLASQTSVDDLPTNAELASAIITGLTTALTEGYRGTGATGSVRDMLYEMLAHLGNMGIAGTTKTLTKLDKATTAKTFTLDDAVSPTSISETT